MIQSNQASDEEIAPPQGSEENISDQRQRDMLPDGKPRNDGQRGRLGQNAGTLAGFAILALCIVVIGLLIAQELLWGSAPEQKNAATLPPVVVNELLTHTDPPQVDSIELHNLTETAIPLDGWCLSDDADTICRYRIPAGTLIQANGYIVLTQQDFEFGLSEMGEDVILSEADATGALTGMHHRVRFDAAANGVALGRIITSDGKEHFPPLTSPTLGGANAPPLVGPIVIAELNYHPAPGQDEYVELVNITADSVALFDEDAPENLWRLTGVGDFDFPAGLRLPGRASLFVTPVAPEEFRARHALPADALVVGPYSGALSDDGEEIALWRPGRLNLDGTLPYLPVDRVDYRDKAPWPTTPDGDGPALQRRVMEGFGSEPQNWQASEEIDG